MEYLEIKTNEDAGKLQILSNGMHDGYIISAEYRADPIDIYDYTKKSLILKVLVTSVEDLTIELCFDNVYDYRINDSVSSYGIQQFSVFFDEHKNTVFIDDLYTTDFKDVPLMTYVVAGRLRWRML